MTWNGFLAPAAFSAMVLLVTTGIVVLTNKSLFDLGKQDPTIFNDEPSHKFFQQMNQDDVI
jgi:hypothetical protein